VRSAHRSSKTAHQTYRFSEPLNVDILHERLDAVHITVAQALGLASSVFEIKLLLFHLMK
jgi:hypothetical protein